MQHPMQSKASSPTLKPAPQTAAGRPGGSPRCFATHKRTTTIKWGSEGESRQQKERGGGGWEWRGGSRYMSKRSGQWVASSVLERMKYRQHKIKAMRQSDIADAQWKGKKKNNSLSAKQVESSLFWVLTITKVLLEMWVESWAGGQVLFWTGCCGGGQQSEKDGPE